MRRGVACACVVAAMALAAPATAEPMPAGRVSLVSGVRTGTGSLYTSIGTGWVMGVEAGYAPLRAPQTIGLGLTWSLLWSSHGSGSARILDQLQMVELDVGARVRMMLGPRRRTVLFVGGGAALIRTNEALFADGDRSLFGPWGAVGIERMVFVSLRPVLPVSFETLMTTSARFGAIRDGQGTAGLMLSFGFGR